MRENTGRPYTRGGTESVESNREDILPVVQYVSGGIRLNTQALFVKHTDLTDKVRLWADATHVYLYTQDDIPLWVWGKGGTFISGGVIDDISLSAGTEIIAIISHLHYLDMLTHRIKGVVDPSDPQDAATKKYVDDAVSGFTTQHDETANRVQGTVYQNTTGKTMMVTVTGQTPNPLSGFFAKTDSSNPPTLVVAAFVPAGNNLTSYVSITFMVLNNNYYSVQGADTAIYRWMEWY